MEYIAPLFAQRGDVGAYGAEGFGAVNGTEASGSFLLQLGHADIAFGLIMPPPGLCRVPWRADTTVVRIPVLGQPIYRHYQRPSRKASNGSGGLYRVGTRPLALACASARSLSRMSACKYIWVVSDDS